MTDCARLRARGGFYDDLHGGPDCRWPISAVNTWSNLAYVVAGLMVALIFRDAPAIVFGLTEILLGIGSGDYHSTKTDRGNSADWGAMYLWLGFLDVVNWWPNEPGIAVGAGIVSSGLAAFFVYRRRTIMRRFDWHMAVLFGLAFLPAYLWGARDLALIGALLFALGFLCWQFDKRGSILVGRRYGHALWHIFTAAGGPFLFAARHP